MAKKEKILKETDYKDTRIEFLEETCRSQLFSLDLLSSLGDLHGSKKNNRNPQAILENSYNYINRLIAFEACAFYKVQESDSDFVLALCKPCSKKKSIQKEVNHAIKNETFAWALNQNQPIVVDTQSSKRKLIIHALATKSRIRGIFIGICSPKIQTLNKQILQSLSIAVHYTASALEAADLYYLLQNQMTELTKKTNLLEQENLMRKQAEKDLRNYTAELKRSNLELENYAYLATHDLQEPLRKIIIFGDRLQNSLGDAITERGSEYLSRMQKAALRMQKFIDDLLEYSRIQVGTKTRKPIDLNRIMDEVAADLNIMITKYRGTVKVNHLPTLEADPVQMHQLFLNLITNALKYHKDGVPPLIKVSSSYNKKIKIWEIRVEDNGIGIDEKHSRRVFRLFERLHGKSDYEGTGIGLGICQKVAHLHHGEITFESKLGQGSTFIITLPEKQPLPQNLSQI